MVYFCGYFKTFEKIGAAEIKNNKLPYNMLFLVCFDYKNLSVFGVVKKSQTWKQIEFCGQNLLKIACYKGNLLCFICCTKLYWKISKNQSVFKWCESLDPIFDHY